MKPVPSPPESGHEWLPSRIDLGNLRPPRRGIHWWLSPPSIASAGELRSSHSHWTSSTCLTRSTTTPSLWSRIFLLSLVDPSICYTASISDKIYEEPVTNREFTPLLFRKSGIYIPFLVTSQILLHSET